MTSTRVAVGAVTVRNSHGALRAGWLVGCDGGRSTVRKPAGFAFPGTDPETTCHQAVVEMTGAEELKVGWTATDTGVYAYGPRPDRIVTVGARLTHNIDVIYHRRYGR